MRHGNILRVVLLAIAIAGAFLVLRSAAPAKNAHSCKESMDDCCKKKEKDGGMIWENISHQFFSSL